MTEIEKKALALVNEVVGSGSWTMTNLSHPYNRVLFQALCRAIERHEAFAQEVSDAVGALKKVWGAGWNQCSEAQMCDDFIIPKPVDPLVEAVEAVAEKIGYKATWKEYAAELRAEGQVRGYEWRKIGEGA